MIKSNNLLKKALFFSLAIVLTLSVYSQKNNGYIILIEGKNIYIDKTSPEVNIGDIFEVIDNKGYIIHPITNKKIKKDPQKIGTLKVTELSGEYSKAVCLEPELISKLEKGMIVSKKQSNPNKSNSTYKTEQINKKSIPVIITPTEVNDITGIGYFGIYVSDMLMEKMLRNNNITLLDRSILDAQINEIELSGKYIDASTSISKGKIKGAKYAIQVTMQKPDVVNMRTGVPLASIMGAIQGMTNTNLGAQYFSNTHTERLKSSVNITARVIDMQTSEVVFMCSGAGEAKGKVQLGLEYGALGGTQINGGVNGFKQTVTGQAIEQAFNFIANGLNKFFNGETTERVLYSQGNINKDEILRASRGKLYLGTQRMNDEDLQSLFENNSNFYFDYKKAIKLRRMSWIPIVPGSILSMALPASLSGRVNQLLGGLVPIALGTTGTVWMIHVSNKKLDKLTDKYNKTNKTSNNWDLSLINNKDGVGLRFSF